MAGLGTVDLYRSESGAITQNMLKTANSSRTDEMERIALSNANKLLEKLKVSVWPQKSGLMAQLDNIIARGVPDKVSANLDKIGYLNRTIANSEAKIGTLASTGILGTLKAGMQ